MRFNRTIIACAVALLPLVSSTVLAGDVLTIAGNVGATNRPAFEPFRDAFFKYHDRGFESAYAFTEDALRQLPQHTVQANVKGWPAALRGTGPRLRDLLKAAKVPQSATLTVISLDGYAAELSPKEIAGEDWILAVDVDGRPLGIGGRGPAWLMHDTGGKQISTDLEAKWIWSAFMIVAK
ncbi:MAG: hypothetical protein RIC14_05210 [Filomicrobium sp.]